MRKRPMRKTFQYKYPLNDNKDTKCLKEYTVTMVQFYNFSDENEILESEIITVAENGNILDFNKLPTETVLKLAEFITDSRKAMDE